jgi:hypothetical protein
LIAFLLSDFTHNDGLDGFAATKAIAAAAENNVTVLAVRTIEKKQFRLNQRGVCDFI